jgi:hypothetical protein
MIDVEDRLRAELAAFVPVFRAGDWSEVITLAGLGGSRHVPRRALVAAIVVVAALLVSVATPVGAAIVHGIGDFSAWLTGEPGSPASKSEQQAFDRANARSWIGFPAGTQLRRLTTTTDRADGVTVELLGFRAGDSLCLRVVVRGTTNATTTSCAPLDDLRQSGSPVRVVLADHGFGNGRKRAWYGIDRFRSSALQVTAGIVADGVQQVVVRDPHGTHRLPVRSNAFLYIAATPEVGQRVSSIWAKTRNGLASVPFAATPFGFPSGLGSTSRKTIPGPTRVDRHIANGTIGWLDRRDLRGQPLDVIPRRMRKLVTRHVVFGRVVAPDPTRPVRVALTLSTSRHGGRATGLCTWLVDRTGMGAGGCAVRAALFTRGPLGGGTMIEGGSDQFATLEGVVSDDVARLDLFLSNGERMTAPLNDNVYLVDVARSKLPVRLVAYDAQGRVIGIQLPFGRFTTQTQVEPARGRAASILKLEAAGGTTAELLIGKATGGGRCFYVRTYFSKHAAGAMVSCNGPTWTGPPLALGTNGAPMQFVQGRVRPDVATVRLEFANGTSMKAKPVRGFVLVAVPQSHHVVSVSGYNRAGRKVGFESFRPHRS